MSLGAEREEAGQVPDRAQFRRITEGRAALTNKKYRTASEIFSRVVTPETKDPDLLRDYAKALTAIGEETGVAEAINLQQRALTESQEAPAEKKAAILAEMGASYGRIGHFETALECYQQTMIGNPANPDIQFLVRVSQGENNVAQKLQRRATRLFNEGDIHAGRLATENAAIATIASKPPQRT